MFSISSGSFVILCFLLCIFLETKTQETTLPWYENLPAVAMDYKVHIDPGKEDCYFQYVNPGAAFYVSCQVVRGGDGMAGFAVRNPKGAIVHPYQWKASSEYQEQTSEGGYYSVCIDNQFSRFAGKLINVYMTVVRYNLWEKYTKEVEELNLNMENFTETIVTVERNINDMLQYQHHSRGREQWDYNLLTANNSYVVMWSIVQIVVIGIASSLQVYFVRKLFDIKTFRPQLQETSSMVATTSAFGSSVFAESSSSQQHSSSQRLKMSLAIRDETSGRGGVSVDHGQQSRKKIS